MSDYNRLRDVVTGLTIFLAHGGDHVEPSHDQLDSGQKSGEILTEEEIATLRAAGWRNNKEFCQCQNVVEDDSGEDTGHEPNCSDWMIFT